MCDETAMHPSPEAEIRFRMRGAVRFGEEASFAFFGIALGEGRFDMPNSQSCQFLEDHVEFVAVEDRLVDGDDPLRHHRLHSAARDDPAGLAHLFDLEILGPVVAEQLGL